MSRYRVRTRYLGARTAGEVLSGYFSTREEAIAYTQEIVLHATYITSFKTAKHSIRTSVVGDVIHVLLHDDAYSRDTLMCIISVKEEKDAERVAIAILP